MKIESLKLKSGLRRVALRWSRLAAVLACFGALTQWIGGVHFLVELGSHFVPYYAIASLAVLPVLLVLRDRRFACAAGLALVLSGIPVAALYLPSKAAPDKGQTFRLMVSNVFTSNGNHARFVAEVRQERPDVIALMEIDDTWVKGLSDLNDEYPYRHLVPRGDNFGIGIMSRLPLGNTTTINVEGVPAIRTSLESPGGTVSLLVVHTLPPANGGGAARRNRQLEMLARITKRFQGPAVVVGDLNTTMWSPYFRALLRDTGLNDARKGFGLCPTWPTNLAPVMIPIDQCLCKGPITVRGARTGTSFGSDHLPLFVELMLPG